MRKFLLLSTIFVASTAFAFSGIGIGHKSSSHKPGVDAIGIHINGNEQADIKIANCDAYAGTGLMNDTTYAGGYAGLASDGQTQCRCETGSKWSDGACIPSEGASCSSWTTNECGSGYYCQFDWTSCSEDPTGGVCVSANIYSGASVYTASDANEYWFSTQAQDWWSAQSVCISQNKVMVSKTDMKCEGDECEEEFATEIMNNLTGEYDFWTSDIPDVDNPCTAWLVWPVEHIANPDAGERNAEFNILCK